MAVLGHPTSRKCGKLNLASPAGSSWASLMQSKVALSALMQAFSPRIRSAGGALLCGAASSSASSAVGALSDAPGASSLLPSLRAGAAQHHRWAGDRPSACGQASSTAASSSPDSPAGRHSRLDRMWLSCRGAAEHSCAPKGPQRLGVGGQHRQQRQDGGHAGQRQGHYFGLPTQRAGARAELEPGFAGIGCAVQQLLRGVACTETHPMPLELRGAALEAAESAFPRQPHGAELPLVPRFTVADPCLARLVQHRPRRARTLKCVP